MKLISSILTLLVLLAALCFALDNRQSATVSLWPFGIEVVAPLYILSLGTLFFGLVLGAVFGWAAHLPHRIEARRLRRDIAGLRDRLEDMQLAGGSQKREESRTLIARLGAKQYFWNRRS